MQNIALRKNLIEYLLLLGLFLGGLIARYFFLDRTSYDWIEHLNGWTTVLNERGFSAFKSNFSNYAYLYLYLLIIVLHLPLSRLYATKLLSIIFDFFQMIAGYKILKLRSENGQFMPLLGGILIFLCPTAIINSSGWAQSDAIPTTFLLFSIYYLLKRRGLIATFCFSISFCFKLQSVFILPVFSIIFFNRMLREYYNVKLYYIFLPIICYILCGLPTLLASRPLWEILSLNIYFKQITLYPYATCNAPTIYSFFHTDFINNGLPSKLCVPFSLSIISIICLLFIRYYKKFPDRFQDSFLLLLQFLTILSIFLLPRMHERYFYFCDIMSIIIFMWYRRPYLIIASALIVFSSMISYNLFFPFMPKWFTITQASFFMLGGVILTGYASWSCNRRIKTTSFRDTSTNSAL